MSRPFLKVSALAAAALVMGACGSGTAPPDWSSLTATGSAPTVTTATTATTVPASTSAVRTTAVSSPAPSTTAAPTSADISQSHATMSPGSPPEDEWPQMPTDPGGNMEWATIGPLATKAECEADAARWPINITDCFRIDGQWYFYAVRQATR